MVDDCARSPYGKIEKGHYGTREQHMKTTTPGTETTGEELNAAEAAPGSVTPSETEIDETAEDKYWRKHFQELGYVEETDDYALFEPAFRTGYMGRRRHPGKTFQEVENELRRDYEAVAGETALAWEKAVCAVCDAWNQAGGAANAAKPPGPRD